MRSGRALGIDEPIVVDGRLDEDAWSRATPLGDFVQHAPDFGEPPHQPTTARVLFDDEALYVGIDCRDDRPDGIVSRLARRDQVPESDRVSIFLDGLGDGRSGFEFTVTVGGVLSDAVLSGDTNSDRSWDGVWWGEVARDAGGWTAEIRIPFRILRWREGLDRAWGLQLRRVVSRTREVSEWQPMPPASAVFVSAFGRLEGLRPPEAEMPLEIRPYTAGRLGLGRGPDSLAPRDTVSGEIGVDAHFAPAPDLSLDGTFNPEFGQVELDPQVVNLSPYETFFPERRPFFLEGIEVFKTPFTLVHTRRIGAAPDVPEAPDGDPLAEIPETTRIWGAVKGTGQLSERTAFGALAAYTGRVEAETQSGATRRAEAPAGFGAVRVRRQLAGTSTVGLLVTGVGRTDGDGAVVGAADWDLRNAGGEWRVSGQTAGSGVDRPGAPPSDGWATTLRAGRIGGETFRPDLSLQLVGSGFDANDLGFVSRDDQLVLGASLVAVRERPWGPARFANAFVASDVTRNLEGDLLGQGNTIGGTVVYRNLWSTHGGFGVSQAHVDDRESRGGPDMNRPMGLSGWLQFDTDFSKPVFGGAGSTLAGGGGAYFSQFAWVTVRPMDAVELALEGRYGRNFGLDRWVATETDAFLADHFVFARAAITQVDTTFRGLVVLSHHLTFQLYAQILRATGDHSRYRELGADGDLFSPAVAHADDADFDTTGVSVQAVLRWEIWTGSPAFLVFRHRAQSDAVGDGESLGDGRDPFLGHVLVRGDDAVLAKMTLLFWP